MSICFSVVLYHEDKNLLKHTTFHNNTGHIPCDESSILVRFVKLSNVFVLKTKPDVHRREIKS